MKEAAILFTLAFVVLVGAGCVGGSSVPTTPSSSIGTPVASGTRMDLGGSGLTQVPSSVFQATQLEELDLSDNQLAGALPSQIQQLKNLRVLDASGNQMTGVPAEIGQLSNLQDLDLSENSLTGLPFELGNLDSLQRLDLRGNDISEQDLAGIRAKLTDTEILVD